MVPTEVNPKRTIRPEQPGDLPAIQARVNDAFGREEEANLVARLGESDGYVPDLSLVALEDGAVVGHIMVTTLSIACDSGVSLPTTILSPLAVAPERQRQGIGGELTRAAIERAGASGYSSMILIGHPAYYPHFGFQPASRWGIRLSFPIPDEMFMAIELTPGALTGAAGTVTLPAAFDGV